MLRITKTCDDAMFQFTWLQGLPTACRPRSLRRESAHAYSYEMVEGCPASPARVWGTLYTHVWPGHVPLSIHRRAYFDYCMHRASKSNLATNAVCFALSRILLDRLTPVTRCHGDPTSRNTIQEAHTEHVILIDPGHPRGLPCREIDEAKIMQTLDGFDEVHTGDLPWPPQSSFFERRPIHWALLMTHYLRILGHNHPKPSLNFAKKRIDEIARRLA